MPDPDYLEISPNGTGKDVVMAGYTDDERFSGDSWHPSLDDAKAKARLWFNVGLEAWLAIPKPKPRATRDD